MGDKIQYNEYSDECIAFTCYPTVLSIKGSQLNSPDYKPSCSNDYISICTLKEKVNILLGSQYAVLLSSVFKY